MGCFHRKVIEHIETDDTAISVIYSPDGQTLVSGTEDGIIRFWDVTNGKLINKITDGSFYAYSLTANLYVIRDE